MRRSQSSLPYCWLTSLAILSLSICVFSHRVFADPPPVINGSPQIFVQRGQSIDLTLDGKYLASVSSIAMSHARGLQVNLVEPDKSAKPDPVHLHLHITADADAALGNRELRLIGPGGVSAPLGASVGQYPQVLEKEPNNTPEQAQEISFPLTLVGKIDSPGDIDCFRFTASEGQQLVFDLHAVRDRSPLDPLMSIHNEAGHELPLKVDLHGGDPVGVFKVPANGNYLLSVRDLQYRGGGDYAYRIDAGMIPYVQSVLPMSAQPGKVSEVKAVGVNLSGADNIPLDLTYAHDGEISVRARASAGASNAMKVDVNELPPFVDEKPAHAAKEANVVSLPVDISGRIDASGDENYFKFHVARKQSITIESIARRLGSPVDPLLTLRNSNGDPMQTADGSAGPDANITRDLDPGDYIVSIRDLFFNGGPRYAYRLQLRPGTTSRAAAQDFSIRFLPDTVRVSRGGNAAIFVDVRRVGDFKGDVTVALEDLPAGVSCPPLVMSEKLPGASGILVLSAAPDAAAGSFPIRLRASAAIGSNFVSHEGMPVFSGRDVDQAFVTVLESAPFNIEAAPTFSAERVTKLVAEGDALAAKLAAANPQRDAAQAEWEKKMAEPLVWNPLDDATLTSAAGVQFQKLEDGSFLAGGAPPESDTYTLTANTDQPGITAIRLETIPDPSLPNKGPGRNGSGNFVLSHFTVTIAPGGTPAAAKPIVLEHPFADFSQDGYPVIDAIEPKPGRGWAMFPRGGKYNRAVFFTKEPAGTAEGSTLVFTLEQKFGQQHTLGRFKLSFTTDPHPAEKAAVPSNILALLTTPADKRPPEAKAQIAAFYNNIDPQVGQDHARLDALREITAVRAEIARLETALTADTPELKAEQEKWEKLVGSGHAWLPLEISSAKSRAGATLTRQPDDSIFVSGADPDQDTYTIVGTTPIKNISAIRIEALPDLRLPGNGPGRTANGNFVLSHVSVFASPKDAMEMNPPVEFATARATFEQQNFPAANALVNGKDTGWAILPNSGKPSVATFYARERFGVQGGSTLTIELDHHFSMAHHTLGRFRISVTANADPDSAVVLPDDILAALKAPAAKRNDKQKKELADYFRTIAPSLQPIRRQLAELKSQADGQYVLTRGKKFAVPFLLDRSGFTGDVRVTLEGFTSGRDPNTAAPTPAGALKFTPVDLQMGKPAGTLEVQVEGQAGIGPRYCVLKAEGKTGDDTRVEYSAPFVVTVLEK
ncbi:MAG TPA: hypothetical protein VFE47_02405 [Tepidisphaeraceae bacterium]|jgi:hypothetical protein|nr:hypothetical protein [Tepidisphaeraceae bacterium]